MSTSLDTQNYPSSAPVEGSIDRQKWVSREFDDQPSATPQEQSFRHSGWAADRRRIYDSLVRTCASERVLDAFANCGNNLWLAQAEDGLVLLSNHCNCRHCVPCSIAKRGKLIAELTAHVRLQGERCRFLTLTMRCSQTPLKDQITRFQESFRRLRQRSFWKERVTAGCLFMEIKIGKNSGAWHVHGHAIIVGQRVDQYDLAKEWHAVTGDSFVVHVSAIHADLRQVRYAAKYATKPLHSGVIADMVRLDECIRALSGRRLVLGFGQWKSIGSDEKETHQRPTNLGHVQTIFANAAAGDPVAIAHRDAALRKWPALIIFSGAP